MAQGISGGNYFAQVNAQFAKDLQKSDGQAATVARNNSGATAQQRKGITPKDKQAGGEDSGGIALSEKAQEALQSDSEMHADQVAEHGHELAQQSGLTQTAEADENGDIGSGYGYERAQEALEEGETPPGFVRLETPEGTPQLLTVEEHAHLEQMDDPDITDGRVLDDIPEANLEAASATLDTQMAQGVSKVANLRTDPKIDAIAEELEIDPQPVLSEPLDILGPGSDKLSGPMPLEFPPEMEQVAAEKAARELAAGGQQEVFLAGPGAEAINAATASAGPSVTAPVAEPQAAMPGEDIGPVQAAAEPAATATAAPAQEVPDIPNYVNQAGQTQQPVQPSFWQRLKYFFTGNPQHLGDSMPPYPAGMYQSPMSSAGYGGMDPYGYMQAASYASSMSWSNPYIGMMGMGSMFSPYTMPNSYYMSTMPGSYGYGYGTPPMQFSPQPYSQYPYGAGYSMTPGYGMQNYGAMPGYGVPGYGAANYGMQNPGMPNTGAPAMQPTQPAGFYRYDPTPQKPGAVVILDTFQPNQDNSSPLGEVATFALGQPRGEVARCELARPAAASGWLTQVQQASPEQIKQQLVQDMAGNRTRLLDGATQNLNGLAQEGLKNSAVNLPNGPSAATDVYSTYGGLAMAWTGQQQTANGQPSGAVSALTNYCRALGLDVQKVMSSDPAVHGPERTRLQQGLVDLSTQVAQQPGVQQSQKAYNEAVNRLAEQKVSVVVTGDVSGSGLAKMAEDRGGRELKTPPDFQKSFYSVDGTVTVGASYRDETGSVKTYNEPGNCDVLADCSIRDAAGQATNLYGATVSAPKVASVLAGLHAKHPEKSNAEVFDMLKSQGTAEVAGTPHRVMTGAAADLLA